MSDISCGNCGSSIDDEGFIADGVPYHYECDEEDAQKREIEAVRIMTCPVC